MPRPPAKLPTGSPSKHRKERVPGDPIVAKIPESGFTPDMLTQVTRGAMIGLTQGQVADVLGVSLSTLQAHASAAYRKGQAIGGHRVAMTIFQLATGAPAEHDADGNLKRAERFPDLRAAVFYARTRLGWGNGQVATDTSGDGEARDAMAADLDAKMERMTKTLAGPDVEAAADAADQIVADLDNLVLGGRDGHQPGKVLGP